MEDGYNNRGNLPIIERALNDLQDCAQEMMNIIDWMRDDYFDGGNGAFSGEDTDPEENPHADAIPDHPQNENMDQEHHAADGVHIAGENEDIFDGNDEEPMDISATNSEGSESADDGPDQTPGGNMAGAEL